MALTLVTQIILDAYRQSNLLALGVSPTEAQTTEALRYLNRIVKSVFGNEAGENFNSFPVGDANYSRPSGYPWNDANSNPDWYVPENTRVVLNISQPTNLYLHPSPDDGARFSVVDASNNVASNNVTIHGNGRRIEGGLSIILNSDGVTGDWFYRGDTGNWVKYAALTVEDLFPFPEEFDDFFITELALRLNPAYGAGLDEQSLSIYRRAKTQLRARYTQHLQARSELGLLRLSKMTGDRYPWNSSYETYDDNSAFNQGRFW